MDGLNLWYVVVLKYIKINKTTLATAIYYNAKIKTICSPSVIVYITTSLR